MLRKILRGERDTQRKAHSSWYCEGIFDNLQPHFTMRKVCLFICTHLLHVMLQQVDGGGSGVGVEIERSKKVKFFPSRYSGMYLSAVISNVRTRHTA